MAIKIVTDSTSYIPKSLIDEYDISVVSLNVAFKDENFREVDIDNHSFYKKMDEKGIPMSSQPSVQELYDAFGKIAIEQDDIVGVFLSSDMSGTYSTANMVKDMIHERYPETDIEIIDSRSNCMQLGYAVIAAAKAAKEGKEMEEVVAEAEKNIKSSRFLFVPETLEYLKKGGRIGTASALIGKILSINPILTVSEGKTTVFDKVRTKKRAIQSMIATFEEDIRKFGFGDIIVHHINCEEEAKLIAGMLKEKLGRNILIGSIGPVIGLHVGPGAIGIAYYTNEALV